MSKLWKGPKKFFMKHKVITAILVFVIIAAINSGGNKDKSNTSDTGVKPTSTSGSNVSAEDKAKAEAEAKAKAEEEAKIIKAGMYKIGTDLPAGEYVLIGSGYMQLSKDSTGTLNSIIANDNTQNRTYITVANDQYLTIQSLKGYKLENAPKVEAKDNILPSGMYKVGADIQPGEYKIKASGDGYVEVTKDSAHSLNSIVSNDNFSGEKYVTIKQGQYIKLNNAELVVSK